MGRLCRCMAQQVCGNIHTNDLRREALCQRPRKAPRPHPRSSTRCPAAKTCELDKVREPQVEKLWTKAGMKCEGIVCGRLRPVCLHETSHSLGGASYCRKAQLIDPDWLLAFAAERYWVQYVTALIPAIV